MKEDTYKKYIRIHILYRYSIYTLYIRLIYVNFKKKKKNKDFEQNKIIQA